MDHEEVGLVAQWKQAKTFLEGECQMLVTVEIFEEDARGQVTYEAAAGVFGVLSRIPDPGERVIFRYKSIEENCWGSRSRGAGARSDEKNVRRARPAALT